MLVNKYIKKVNEVIDAEEISFFYIFRGQSNVDYGLECSAARSFNNSEDKNKEFLLDNQMKMIGDIEIRGLNFSKVKQRDLYHLELLADLRHYGTPSCLFDFTSNFLIALWFACAEQKEGEDGEVFILNCHETDKFSMVSSKNIKKNIDYFFQDKFDRLWYWVPERLNQRLTDQDAVFVFGQPKIEIEECKSVKIEHDDKKGVLEELEKFFDYTKRTLFADKYALGEVYKDFNEEMKGEGRLQYYLDEAIYYIQEGDFSRAKERLDRVRAQAKNKKFLLEAHFQSALADIEDIKMKLKKDNREAFQLASHHLQALGKKDESQAYIKCFKFCIENDYKKEKSKFIQDEFERILQGLIFPEDQMLDIDDID